MYRQKHATPRTAFTLVELMVAMALIIFIMYVLAEAFSAGAGAFRNLKAIGDMNERLRSVSTVLRRYLAADHFDGKRRLSDPNFWGPPGKESPPEQGFFRLWQNTTPVSGNLTAAYALEGTDLDNNSSFLARDHGLHFTVRLRGNNRGDYFRAGVPSGSPLLNFPNPDSRYQESGSNIFTGQWAEVAIYLRPVSPAENTEDPANTSGTSLPLHTLFMRQRLLVSDHGDIPNISTTPVPAAQASQYLEVSQVPEGANLHFNSPADVTMPIRRFMGGTSLAGTTSPGGYNRFADEDATQAGNDVLLNDVLSFEVRVLLNKEVYGTGSEEFIHLHDSRVTPYVLSNTALAALSPVPRVFDTWSARNEGATRNYSGWKTPGSEATIPLFANSGALPLRIRAVQITIRIWDSKTRQARQTSVVVDL